jgi:hypothetical protein
MVTLFSSLLTLMANKSLVVFSLKARLKPIRVKCLLGAPICGRLQALLEILA